MFIKIKNTCKFHTFLFIRNLLKLAKLQDYAKITFKNLLTFDKLLKKVLWNFKYFGGITKYDYYRIVTFMVHQNGYGETRQFMENQGSCFLLEKCVKKYMWNSESYYKLFYCAISTASQRCF